MQTTERHGHAGECYETTAKRCGALLQWINMVSVMLDIYSVMLDIYRNMLDIYRNMLDIYRTFV